MKMATKYNNLQWMVEEAQAGNSYAFGVIVSNYNGKLLNFVRNWLHDHDEAEDLVQETYIRMFRNIKRYDEKKGSFSLWMFTIAINLIRNEKRNKTRRKTDTFNNSILEKIIIGEDVEYTDLSYVKNHIDKLKDKYRLPIIYFYYGNKRYKEIAEILGISMGSVKSRIRRAKKILGRTIIND